MLKQFLFVYEMIHNLQWSFYATHEKNTKVIKMSIATFFLSILWSNKLSPWYIRRTHVHRLTFMIPKVFKSVMLCNLWIFSSPTDRKFHTSETKCDCYVKHKM